MKINWSPENQPNEPKNNKQLIITRFLSINVLVDKKKCLKSFLSKPADLFQGEISFNDI